MSDDEQIPEDHVIDNILNKRKRTDTDDDKINELVRKNKNVIIKVKKHFEYEIYQSRNGNIFLRNFMKCYCSSCNKAIEREVFKKDYSIMDRHLEECHDSVGIDNVQDDGNSITITYYKKVNIE